MKSLTRLCQLTLTASLWTLPGGQVSGLDEKPAPQVHWEIPALPEVMNFPAIDGVYMRDGALFHFDNGQKQKLVAPLRMGSEYEVRPDGQVLKATSALWHLSNGEMLFPDGSIMLADGSMSYLGDHYVQQAGKLIRVSGGKQTPVAAGHQLPNGIILKDYGRMLMPNGHISILQDGQILRADGEELPAWDTIQYHNGSVKLFKDGSLLSLPPNRLMIMNDGTKVWGNGAISRRTQQSGWDEVKFQLPEGAMVRLPRVAGPTNTRRLRQGY